MPKKSREIILTSRNSNKSFREMIVELWGFRGLLRVLVHRAVSVRFAQTTLGVFWVVLQPVLLTAIFALVFGYLARVPSPDVPYPVLVLSGLLLWQYFSRSVSEGSTGLQSYASMITKVYFPRMIVLLIAPVAAAIDLLVGVIVLFVLMISYGIWPSTISLLVFPFVIIATGLLAFSMSLIIAPLGARRRDVILGLPFVLQLGMYITPVVYPVGIVPEKYQDLLYLNPMTTLVEGWRWALLGGVAPAGSAWLIFIIEITIFLMLGKKLFQKAEANLVDEL